MRKFERECEEERDRKELVEERPGGDEGARRRMGRVGERTHEREGERIANSGRKKARERGTVTKEERRLGAAGAESETAESKCECESNRKNGRNVPRGHELGEAVARPTTSPSEWRSLTVRIQSLHACRGEIHWSTQVECWRVPCCAKALDTEDGNCPLS